MIETNLNFNEFMIIWGIYGISLILAIGLGYAWGWFSKNQEVQN